MYSIIPLNTKGLTFPVNIKGLSRVLLKKKQPTIQVKVAYETRLKKNNSEKLRTKRWEMIEL